MRCARDLPARIIRRAIRRGLKGVINIRAGGHYRRASQLEIESLTKARDSFDVAVFQRRRNYAPGLFPRQLFPGRAGADPTAPDVDRPDLATQSRGGVAAGRRERS